MQEEAVELLANGVVNVMRHLAMIENVEDVRMSNDETVSKAKRTVHRAVATTRTAAADTATPTLLTKFEWLYTESAGMWYPKIAAGDVVKEGEQIGKVGDFFGDILENVISPVNGVVLFLTINPSVLENGLLMGIGLA